VIKKQNGANTAHPIKTW